MTDPGGITGEEIGGMAGMLTAAGGVLALAGKGVVWMFRQRKSRLTQLESRVDQFEEAKLDYVRKIDCLVTVCVVLIEDIEATNPASRAISQAKALIGTEFPDLLRRTFRPHATPAEMNDLLNRMP